MSPAVRVAIALGSNLGDRDRLLNEAVAALRERVDSLRVSSWHSTEPVGVPGTQPEFLNGAAVGFTHTQPRDLLNFLLETEQRFGRERPYPAAARTLDLDLILYGDRVIDEPGLIVPHPRFRERRFVLAPLAEIAADWIDPVTRRTVGELLERLAADL
jgi:2-amino-4-hydroxy-6-hydroxymethyldihydropteridine diphosphokinase